MESASLGNTAKMLLLQLRSMNRQIQYDPLSGKILYSCTPYLNPRPRPCDLATH